MERWSGVLKIPLDATTSNYYRVAASLCLSSSKTLTVSDTFSYIFYILNFQYKDPSFSIKDSEL